MLRAEPGEVRLPHNRSATIGSVQEYYAVGLGFSVSWVDSQTLSWRSGPKLKRYVYHRIYNRSTNKTIFSDSAQENSYNYGTWGKTLWDTRQYGLIGNAFHYYFRTSFWAQGYTNPSEPSGRFFAPERTSAVYVCGSVYGCEF